MKSYVALWFVCAIALFSSGCTSTPPPVWSEGTVEAKNDEILWGVTRLSLEKTGFPIGSGLDREKLHAVSGWKTQLAPFKGEGFRERCEIRYQPLDGRRYAVQVRVERERNDDLIHPLDLSYAQWETDPDDVEKSRIVLSYIRALLGSSFEMKKDENKQDAKSPAKPASPTRPVE